MTEKSILIQEAQKDQANISALARELGISRKTAYKWMKRFQDQGIDGLDERSRRPRSSPNRTERYVEELILATRNRFQEWGPRKLKRWLENQGYHGLPAPSTISAILKREGCISEEESLRHAPFIRFEHENPNDLLQCDFKGWFQVGDRQCHPLTVLDDHSRFCLGIRACPNESGAVAKPHFIDIFREYGLPERMTMDNGTPCGAQDKGISRFEVWLMRLGIRVSHSRPHHPQTQGKDERFHRTLKAELIRHHKPRSLNEAQQLFDEWRRVYNEERPHDALGLEVPLSRYRPSLRSYPEKLPEVEYAPGADLRKVGNKGRISVRNRHYFISEGLANEYVELRETCESGVLSVYFADRLVRTVDLRAEEK